LAGDKGDDLRADYHQPDTILRVRCHYESKPNCACEGNASNHTGCISEKKIV
jgi:hypothetical protein